MKILRVPILMLVYFSIATVLAETGALAALLLRDGLQSNRFIQLVAVAYDIDLYSMWSEMEAAARPIQKAQVSHHEVLHARQELNLDLDLREIASDKGLQDIRQLQAMLSLERERYENVRDEFERRLEQARRGAVDQALLDVQRQLEALPAKLAKDQVIRILDDDSVDSEKTLQFVVTIVKALPQDKRKKILAEFKNEDSERLHEILRQVRLGVPDVQLIRETRSQLKQFMSRE